MIGILSFILLSYCVITIAANGDDRGPVDRNYSNFKENNPKYNLKPKRNKKIKSNIQDSKDIIQQKQEKELHETDDEEVHLTTKKGAIKSIIEKSLYRTRTTSSRALKIIQTHKTLITTALIIFAFRREFWNILVSITTRPKTDGKGRTLSLSPTAILKIVVFLDLMRKLQVSPDSQSDGYASTLGPRTSISQFFLHHFKGAPTAYIPPVEQHYTFERLNDRYIRDLVALRKATGVSNPKIQPVSTSQDSNSTAIILDLKKLDHNRMEALNDEVSFLLLQHRIQLQQQEPAVMNTSSLVSSQPWTEIIILLESPGGSASDFGLAASQIGRLRDEPMMRVTVCVDKVAASGGYMMACMASPGFLFAAPFAIVGSIGVLGQALNIHNTLSSWGIQSLVFRGGKDKAPVGLVGEVTKEGIDKVQDMIDRAHVCFKRHVSDARPVLIEHLDKVTTGDVWLGYDALQVGLIDGITTSDEYIGEKLRHGCKVLKLIKYEKPRFIFGSPMPLPILPGARSFLSNRASFGDWIKSILNAAAKLVVQPSMPYY